MALQHLEASDLLTHLMTLMMLVLSSTSRPMNLVMKTAIDLDYKGLKKVLKIIVQDTARSLILTSFARFNVLQQYAVSNILI